MTALIVIAALGGCAGSRPDPPSDEGGFMQWAQKAYEEEAYDDLVLALRQFLPAHAGSRHTEEATLLLGKALYKQDLYVEAEEQFRALLRDFPGGEFAPDAMYHLGLALLAQSRPAQLDQKETLEALGQFQSFVSRYPDHRLGPGAQKHILAIRTKLAEKEYLNGKLYLRRGQHRPARQYFRDKVLRDYGDTEFAVLALHGLAESYNETHEWQKLADTCKELLERFPKSHEAPRAKSLLEKARKEGAAMDIVVPPADTTVSK